MAVDEQQGGLPKYRELPFDVVTSQVSPESEEPMTQDSSSGPSDLDVVTAILDGDRSQFAWLVSRYRIPLWLAARSRLGDAGLAEDVVQDTFMHVFRYLETFNPNFAFRTWLWTILFRQCHQAWQRQSRYASSERVDPTRVGNTLAFPVDAICDSSWDEFSKLERQERTAALHRLLANLPDVQADALRLRFFGGLKFQEIADVMNSSLSAAKQRVRNGLVNLSHAIRSDASLAELMAPVAEFGGRAMEPPSWHAQGESKS